MTQAGMILGHGGVHDARSRRAARPSTSARTSGRSACVLYEMLTGRRAFEGEDVSRDLARGAAARAGLGTRCRPTCSPRVRDAAPALPGEGSARSASATSATCGSTLEGALRTTGGRATTAHPSSASTRTAGVDGRVAAAVLAAVALAVPAVRHLRETPPPAPPETRVEINTPATDEPDFVCPLARRPPDRLRRLRRRRLPPVAAVPGDRPRRSRWPEPKARSVSLLVARQPLGRLLRRWQAEAARHRRRRAANPGNGAAPAAAGPGTRTASFCLRRPRQVRCSACPASGGAGGGGDDARTAAD